MTSSAKSVGQSQINVLSSQNGQSWELLKQAGNKAFRANAWDDAIKYYTEALKLNVNEAILHSNRSAVYLKKGDYFLAAADAKRAIQLDSNFIKAYTRMYSALCQLGQFSEARQILSNGILSITSSMASHSRNSGSMQKVNDAKPATITQIRILREMHREVDNTERAVNAATQMLQQGKYDDAKKILSQPVHAFPSCRTLCFLWAQARAPSQPDEVNAYLIPFNSTSMDDPKYLYLRALTSYHRGQEGFKNAQFILRQALEFDPDFSKAMCLLKKIRHIEAHKQAGNTAFKQKKAADAVREYTAAIDEDVSNTRMQAVLRGNRAAARMQLNDLTGALLDCDFAINHGLSLAKLYVRRSRIEQKLDKYDDALHDMQQAVELDKNYSAQLRSLKARAKQARRKDYYKTLGLSNGENNEAAIKRAYKKACLQWHPDKWAHASQQQKLHAERQFKQVGQAFGVLSDRKKKQMYDSGQMDNDVIDGNSAESRMYGFPTQNDQFSQMFQYMFSDGGGGGGSSGFQTSFVFGNASPFVTHTFTQGSRRRRRGTPIDQFDF